jgi:hypothetical protein
MNIRACCATCWNLRAPSERMPYDVGKSSFTMPRDMPANDSQTAAIDRLKERQQLEADIAGDRVVTKRVFSGTLPDGTPVEVQGYDVFTFREWNIAVDQGRLVRGAVVNRPALAIRSNVETDDGHAALERDDPLIRLHAGRVAHDLWPLNLSNDVAGGGSWPMEFNFGIVTADDLGLGQPEERIDDLDLLAGEQAEQLAEIREGTRVSGARRPTADDVARDRQVHAQHTVLEEVGRAARHPRGLSGAQDGDCRRPHGHVGTANPAPLRPAPLRPFF